MISTTAGAGIKEFASVMDVEAAMTRSSSLRRGHLGRRTGEDVALERMVETWESQWGTKMEMEEISYWRFVEDGGVVMEMDEGNRRRAIDGGSIRYMPKIDDSDQQSQMSDELDAINKIGFFGFFRKFGVLIRATIKLMAMAASS